jgi:large conductance mechanosensitive channel
MRKLFKEFKDFIDRGSVMDLAVAVIMGAAFTAIINAVVNDLVTPLLSVITLGIDFSSLQWTFGFGATPATFTYGKLIQAVINFLLVAIVIFFMVKGLNKIAKKKPEADVLTKTCPFCCEEIPEKAVRCSKCTTILDIHKIPPEQR